MSGDKFLHVAIKKLRNEVANLSTDEAIAHIDREVEVVEHEYFKPHFLVRKAEILWFADRQQEAIASLKECAAAYPDEPSVTFFLGQYLVELALFDEAISCLAACINSSQAISDTWYLDSAHLLNAYAAAKVHNKRLALTSLDQVEDDESMSWLDTDPPISKQSILKMLGS